MKKGEIATFFLRPEYGYGPLGSPPTIPGDALLEFEIELISFKNFRDVTSDGGVLKKLLEEAPEKYGPSPSFESGVTVEIVGRVAAKASPFMQETRSLVIGEEELPVGVERAIETLKAGEKAQFVILPSYGYGASGNRQYDIPAGATLWYEIKLLQMTKDKDYWQYDNFDEQFQQGQERKTQGNELFANGKFTRAISKYKRAIDFVDYLNKATESEKTRIDALRLACFLNLSQCFIKVEDWKNVVEYANKALALQRSPKALFRRAQGYSGLDIWDLAQADFEDTLLDTPDDPVVIQEYNRLKAKMRAQDAHDKRLFSNLFR